MFDIDSGKLLIIGIIALVVIGPKELPGVLRQVGQAIGKLRRMATEFQSQFMDAMRESELEDLKKDVEKMSKIGDIGGLDPFDDVKKQMNDMRSDVESALSDVSPPVASAEIPALPEGPAPGDATTAGSGIGPVVNEVPATPEPPHTGDAQTVKSGGAA